MPARTKKVSKTKKRNKRVSPVVKSIKKVALVVLVTFVAGVFISGTLAWNSLNAKFADAQSASSLNQSFYTLLYVIVDDIKVDTPVIKEMKYSVIDLEGKRIDTYDIPQNFEFTVPKFGNVTINKLFALGQLNSTNKLEGGVNFVNAAVFNYFAFPADKYVYVSVDHAAVWNNVFKTGTFIPAMLELIEPGANNDLYTNLIPRDLYNLSNFIKGLPEDRFSDSEITNATSVVLDDAFREVSLGGEFAKEAKSIAVLNATDTAGVASFAARVINNMGGRVVAVDNSEEKYSENFIISDEKEGYSTQSLAHAFGITKIIDKASAKQSITDDEIYRADILLILGAEK